MAAVANTVVSPFYYLRLIAAIMLRAPRGRVALMGSGTGIAMVVAGLSMVIAWLAAQGLLQAFEK